MERNILVQILKALFEVLLHCLRFTWLYLDLLLRVGGGLWPILFAK